MKRTTISIPDKLLGKIKHKVEEEGFLSMTDYIISLIREDTKSIPTQWESPPHPISSLPDSTPGSAVVTYPNIPPLPPQPIMHPQAVSKELPIRIPQTPTSQPLHPKKPVRDPNAPDPYLVYGGKCQFKNVSADNIMCLQTASKKIYVAQNTTGDRPNDESFTEAYLCPDHTGHVSHSSGFFVK